MSTEPDLLADFNMIRPAILDTVAAVNLYRYDCGRYAFAFFTECQEAERALEDAMGFAKSGVTFVRRVLDSESWIVADAFDSEEGV